MNKYPKLQNSIRRARQRILNHCKVRNLSLSHERIYYVYALLDPRKPGKWKYQFLDRQITFPFKPFYIGKGKGRRAWDHQNSIDWNVKGNKHISKKHKKIKAIIKAGLNVKVVKSKLMSEASALARELVWIQNIKRVCEGGPLTNILVGGLVPTGHKHTQEHKDYLSKLFKGRKATEESKRKISEAKKGKKFSKSHKAALSAARIGLKFSEDGKAKLKEAHSKISQEQKNLKTAKRLKTLDRRTEEEKNFVRDRASIRFSNMWDKRTDKERKRVLKGIREAAKRPEVIAERSQRFSSLNKIIKTCPHCRKKGEGPAMKRWHFDNCKLQ